MFEGSINKGKFSEMDPIKYFGAANFKEKR